MNYGDLVKESFAIKSHMKDFLASKLKKHPNIEYKIKLPDNTYELIKFDPEYSEVKIMKRGSNRWNYLSGYSIEFILDVCHQVSTNRIIKNG